MTELVAVRGELQLFAAGDVGVIVDTQALDVYDPAPLSELLAQDGWTSAGTRDKAMVASAHRDLAETQLSTRETATGRTFRVPKAVREAAAQGLAWREDPLVATGGTPYGVGVARKLLSGTVSEDTIRKMAEFHAKNTDDALTAAGAPSATTVARALWGADAGREWAQRIVSVVTPPKAVVAAAVVTDDEPFVDPTQPHEFKVFAEGDTTCAFCGAEEGDEIHVVAGADAPAAADEDSAGSVIQYFALLDPSAEGTTFTCLGLYAQDNGGWFVREDEEWIPTDAPSDPDNLALLDDESFQSLLAQVDDPTTTTLELSISEGRLAELALPELDLDLLDAVFAQAPYVDPQVRSQNATKQVRDSNGRFIQVGAKLKTTDGKTGTVVSVNEDQTVNLDTGNGVEVVPADSVSKDHDASSQKARLKAPGTLVPDVKARIEQYIAENGGADAAPAESAPAEFAAGDAPGGGTVKPLYLAIVDKNDTQAVMDLVAIIPAEGGHGVEAYRRDEGNWVLDANMLDDLQGVTPPPVVELDQNALTDVLSQMDASSVTASGALHVFTITASGELAQETFEMPVQLPTYDKVGLPRDLIGRLDELAEGGADRNRGNAERLRRYWTTGEGGAKIGWNSPGDWTRCVNELEKHLGPRAKGYCALRHKEMDGMWPGDKTNPGMEHLEVLPSLQALVGELQFGNADGDNEDGDIMPQINPEEPHEFVSSETDSQVCAICGDLMDVPIHIEAPTSAEPADFAGTEVTAPTPDAPKTTPKDNPEDPYWSEAHPYEDAPAEGTACFCGKESDDPIHLVTVEVPDATAEDPDPEDMPALSASADLPGGGAKFKIPVVVPEGKESGDGRSFASGALSSRDMPLALMWQMITDEGHKQSVIVGRIDHVEQLPEGGLGNAYGVFDTGAYGQEALRLVRAGMLRGISADLDMFEANVMQGEGEEQGNKLAAQKMEITSARLMGITLVAKPAFAECVIMLDEGEDPQVTDGIYTERNDDAVVAALTAAAAPLEPPKAWFENPGLSKPTHLTVTDDGRVFGHIAAWDVNHIGLPYGTRPPKSASNYAYFRTGSLRTQEGEDIRVGQLTLWGGHAPLQADARMAVQHYDDTNSAVADLAAGEDRYGIWVSGALRPGVTPEQVRALRASSPSGDWRPIKGMLELVAVCQVNVPGFPIAQSMVAGGQVTALVAAGIQPLIAEKHERELGIKDQLSYIESALGSLLADRAKEAAARMRPALEEKRAALTASATSASERIAALKAERDAALTEKAERARAIVASLRVAPDFKEEAHPRDEHGMFRHKLAILKAKLDSPEAGPAAAEGLNKLEDAANAEDAGDTHGASKAAGEAADALESAASNAEGSAKEQLAEAAGEVRQAIAHLDFPAEDATPATFDELPQALKDLIVDALDKAEKQVNPADPDALLQKMKGFVTGTNYMSPTQIVNFLQRQLKQETTNKVTP